MYGSVDLDTIGASGGGLSEFRVDSLLLAVQVRLESEFRDMRELWSYKAIEEAMEGITLYCWYLLQ